MSVDGLNHFNIMAPPALMSRVRDFYVDVIGLEEGFRPSFDVPGHWLYAAGQPVLHLLCDTERNKARAGSDTYLDHVAFSCSGMDDVIARLHRLDVEFRRRDLTEFGFVQLFVVDPAGLGIELNFAV